MNDVFSKKNFSNFGLANIVINVFFFLVNFSNSFDLQETSVLGVFEVPEYESSIKIEVEQCPVCLGPIFAGNCGITREQWIGKGQRHLHRFSRTILHKKRGTFAKILKSPKFRKMRLL